MTDQTGMVFVPKGLVSMGNGRAEVIAQIQSAVGLPASDADLSALGANSGIQELLTMQIDKIDQLLEPESQSEIEGFWIDTYEVTNTQYASFIHATGYEAPATWTGTEPPAGKENHPVECVRYQDAEAYARWAGKELPTSQQWTRAFRGESVSFFPWGDNYKPGMANTLENTVEATAAVDATPEDVSPFEVYNLVGNVCEYVRGETTFIGNRCVMVKGGVIQVTRLYTRYRGTRLMMLYGAALPGVGFRCVSEEP